MFQQRILQSPLKWSGDEYLVLQFFYWYRQTMCIFFGQCIKQFFNFSFDLCKLNLIGDQFRICFFLFGVSDLKVLKPCPHGIENKLLLFSLVDFTTSLTAPPSVLYSGNIPDCFALGYFQSISATPHLTFPANHIFFGLQPCAGRSYLSLVSFCISARRHMSASCGTITSI